VVVVVRSPGGGAKVWCFFFQSYFSAVCFKEGRVSSVSGFKVEGRGGLEGLGASGQNQLFRLSRLSDAHWARRKRPTFIYGQVGLS
jgi:hypothetical protein